MAIWTISITDVPQRVDPNPCEQDVPFVVIKMNPAKIQILQTS
jgi:hypothetical protein